MAHPGPRGELDPRVDRPALDELLDHAFSMPEPDDLERTHSVVIVQHGAIVAERHAHDVAPDDAFLSWSMANIGGSHCHCSAQDFARFGHLFLRDGLWDGERILPEGWVDYSRTGRPQSEGIYGAHFWVIPGSLGLFNCGGMGGQRIVISPKLDLVVVRLGKTAPHKVGAVVEHSRKIVDAFRPTSG